MLPLAAGIYSAILGYFSTDFSIDFTVLVLESSTTQAKVTNFQFHVR